MAQSDFLQQWSNNFFASLQNPTPLDYLGSAVTAASGIFTPLAAAGLEAEAATEAARSADLLIGGQGAVPGIGQGTAMDGMTGFFRDLASAAFATAAGWTVGDMAVAAAGAVALAPEVAIAAGIAATVGAAYIAGKEIATGVDTLNSLQQQANSSGQAVYETLSDGSNVTVNTDGSYALTTNYAVYYYDASGNPTEIYFQGSGYKVQYDSETNTITATDQSGDAISTQVSSTTGGGLSFSDPSDGQSTGELNPDGTGGYSISDSSSNSTISIPGVSSEDAVSVTRSNGDGTFTTTTESADGSTWSSITMDSNGNTISTSQSSQNSDGTFSVQVFDGSGNHTDTDNFNVSGQLIQDNQFQNGTLYDIINYSNGIEADQAFYNSSGQITQDQFHSDGYISSAINYSDGVKTDQVFYNSSEQATGQAVFDPSGAQTDFKVFDPSTGQMTQDQQIQNGVVVDAINYSNGVKTDESSYNTQQQMTSDESFDSNGVETDNKIYDPSTGQVTADQQYENGVLAFQNNFNGSGQLTSQNDYNSSGQLTDEKFVTAGTNNVYQTDIFDPSTGQETAQQNFNTSGQMTSQDNFNTSGQLVSQNDYNSSGQEVDQLLVTPGTTDIYGKLLFDPSTGQETAQQNFNTSGQMTSQDNFNTSGQLVSQNDYNSSGQEVDQLLVTPGTTDIYGKLLFDPSTGQETAQQNFNTSGQMTSQDNFNTSGQLVSQDDYNAAGQETEQQVVVPGTTTLQTQYFFDTDGHETYQNNFTNGVNTSRQFYNDAGQETAEALFGSDGKLTEYGTFNPSTGQVTQDVHYDDGTPTLVTNYDNGNAVNSTFYNSGGQETQYTEYSNGTTTNYLFNPGDPYSYESQTVNSGGSVTEQAYYNASTGQLQEIALFDGGPYAYEIETSNGGQYFSQVSEFDSETGQETGSATYDSSTGDVIGASGSMADDTAIFDGGYDDYSGGYFGGYDGGDDFGGYGFAGKQATVQKALNQGIGEIAKYDLAHGDTQGANAAEAALRNAAASAEGTATSGSGNAVMEGAKWDSQIITWSLAAPTGANGAATASYDSAAEQAFAAWAAASGLTFKEVSDSSQANIQIGFSDLDTKQSGVVGYTTYQAQSGQISAANISLEDPNQDALLGGTAGQLRYSGTSAQLEQVIEHEIGHALGFADNADPASIMYYALTRSNRTLDATDQSGAQKLYGTAASGSIDDAQRVDQLVQAMASYAPGGGTASNLVPTEHSLGSLQLAAPAH
ncbi:matrixin family metalloprotease [Burkholderia seminalis]|uniref:matrixin family metalloprotease n=1 Tax=Burkholderia seminalis TaxID=488731 RepID=UPI002653DDC2|nr:matrixin family metalloprotease [Burkholderia seminalis]MDN7592066.1 matrixin family metalloprotease [Burkholderia seminalis]